MTSKITNCKQLFKNINQDIAWSIFLLLSALILYLIGLGDLPLRDWDEGYYGTVAKDIYKSGNWLYMTYHNEPFLLKPPLIIWLINMSYLIGGISEFTTRFPCAFLTACGVPLLYLIGRAIFPSRLPAIFSTLVYLTLLPMVRHGRLAMLDGSINTFFIFSIFCLLQSFYQKFWIIGVGIGLGLIAMTKGILVIALGGILGVFCIFNKSLKILKDPLFWGGFILGFSPVILWYSLQIIEYGEKFIKVHFLQQNLDRLSTAVEGNKGSVWYYVIELVKYSFPWLLFLPGGLILAIKKYQQSWAKLVLVGFILFIGIISLMSTKLPWYIMPVYPFFSLAVGAYLAEIVQNNYQFYPKILGILLLISSIVSLGVGVYFSIKNNDFQLLTLSILIGITFALSYVNFLQKNYYFIFTLFVGLYFSLGTFVMSDLWIWELNESFPVKPVATLIRENTPPNTVVYTSYTYSRTSLDFYSDRQVIAQNIEELKKLAAISFYFLLDPLTLKDLNLNNYKILGNTQDFILIKNSRQ
ncbi:MAG: ArnT family glycosyltransferase [cyanobacterium endosymbiont of Rhopalodia musculus]|uniref:ArnT family glycosyltransferase n=1 Tax=cyanobacterium endosymbiont of Epithemia clementina EcSB TaxID=3034674 RepID=UPI0024818305|nr:glycosyltransferase family 39 protein [cyanobacterium endosymbiont of Epithemia clementina EcSB]WGT68198.1 glycosyltransferase family 39 protein [cyanobacterium endosymbiont of Epithemia clementina EcSB]